MTVKEMIEELSRMPEDAVVIHDMMSDYEELGYPSLIKAEDKLMVIRNGGYMDYHPNWWSKDEIPNFVTVVYFMRY